MTKFKEEGVLEIDRRRCQVCNRLVPKGRLKLKDRRAWFCSKRCFDIYMDRVLI